jgi:hypothetical protein
MFERVRLIESAACQYSWICPLSSFAWDSWGHFLSVEKKKSANRSKQLIERTYKSFIWASRNV